MKTMFTEVTPLHLLRRAGRVCGAVVSAGAAAILLSGCNSSTSTTPFDATEARRLTEAEAPAETVAQAEERGDALGPEIDLVAVSRLYVEITDGRDTLNLAVDCSGTTCRWTDSLSGDSVTIPVSDSVPRTVATRRAVLTKNGFTLLEGRGGDNGPNYRVYGAWGNHGGFILETAVEAEEDGITAVARGATVFGDSTGTRPTTDATWRGVMVGTPARGSWRDNILQGDATLTYRALVSQIDATFDNIVDLDREAPHSVRQIQFSNIPVGTNGTYQAGRFGDGIRGTFAGPNHEETGGVFESNDIVGAYGAKRQAN